MHKYDSLAKKRVSGFTLIELLVVIAIIAILAAILFPVFGRARENARRSSCQSNLKQIGLGIMQYTQDYDEKFPKAWYNSTGGGFHGDSKWMDVVQPYIKSTQLFVCPSASGDEYTYEIRKNTTPYRWGSYTINSAYWDANSNPSNKRGPANDGMSIANVEATATTGLVFDGNAGFQIAWNNPSSNPTALTKRGSNNCLAGGNNCGDTVDVGGIVERHLETTNVLYCDGHVKSSKLQSLMALSTDNYLKVLTPADD